MKQRIKNERKKVLLVLPLLVLPFLALAFYAMGGGHSIDPNNQIGKKSISTVLPDAKLDENRYENKLSYYEKYAKDSSSRGKNEIRNLTGQLENMPQSSELYAEEIEKKVGSIEHEINKPVEVHRQEKISPTYQPEQSNKADITRLEAMMQSMQNGETEDPEIDRITKLLKSISDVQHPELINNNDALEVRKIDSVFTAIPAEIAEKAKVSDGGTVKLILTDSAVINGLPFKMGQEVFGKCRITNQRLLITVENIRLGRSIVPVGLIVYALDGMEGLYLPEAVLNETASQGTSNILRDIDMFSSGQSLGSDVAGAGFNAARSILEKKVRKIKVKLKAGEPVLLHIKN